MNLHKLETLVKEITAINHLNTSLNQGDVHEKKCENSLCEMKATYGSFLEDRLFDIYDDYFEDDEIRPLDEYLSTEGVAVYGDEVGERQLNIYIKSDPLRIELVSPQSNYKDVVWAA